MHFDLLAPLGMVGLTILTGAILTLPNTNADDSAVVTATITVPVSCSMSGTGMNSHTAEIPNGIDSRGSDYYPNGIGQTTLRAYCNDNEGFSIYAVGYTGDTIGNTYLRDANLGQTDDIITGTTFSGNTSNWAMKIGVTAGTYTPIIAGSSSDTERQSGDTDYSDWAIVPASYQRVAYRNSGTDVDNENVYAEGAMVTATYATYISPTQKAGTYVGQVKYTLVHPANEVPLQPQTTEAGCIRYYPNGGNVEGTMGCQSISASATSATLLASNFSREGYGFAGWSTTYDYSDSTGFLGPQEYITFTAGQYTGTNNGLSLYARWIKSAGNLQGWTGCSSLASGAVTALTDQRDNETYAVAKLADGKCWMIENLRLADTHQEGASTVATTLTTANTNNPLNDGTNVTLKHNYTDTDTFTNLSPTSAVAYDASTAPEGWCTTNSAACDDQSRIRTDNTANRANNSPNTNSTSMYSYGNYYNWYSATAGNGTYSYSTNNNSVGGDLCPTGWRLPVGGQVTVNTTGDFYVLAKTLAGMEPNNANSGYSYYSGTVDNVDVGKLASDALRAYPNNYLYSGYVSGGSLGNRGSNGCYWSSTANLSNYAYSLYLNSSSVYPGANNYNKYNGRAVRCLSQ